METNNSKTTATVTHLSALSQYFIPFGNFLFPIVIWSSTKRNSGFVDHHGRQAINFQLSIFLYSLILFLIAVPIFLTSIFKNVPFTSFVRGEDVFADFSAANISGIVTIAVVAAVFFFFIKVAEFFLIINAAVMAANGKYYSYPLTINFIKQTVIEDTVPTAATVEAPLEV